MPVAAGLGEYGLPRPALGKENHASMTVDDFRDTGLARLGDRLVALRMPLYPAPQGENAHGGGEQQGPDSDSTDGPGHGTGHGSGWAKHSMNLANTIWRFPIFPKLLG